MTFNATLTQVRMARLIAEALEADDISQAAFARTAGVSAKHLNQVLNGHAAAQPAQLDYWAFLLGRGWHVSLLPAEANTPMDNPRRSDPGTPEEATDSTV